MISICDGVSLFFPDACFVITVKFLDGLTYWAFNTWSNSSFHICRHNSKLIDQRKIAIVGVKFRVDDIPKFETQRMDLLLSPLAMATNSHICSMHVLHANSEQNCHIINCMGLFITKYWQEMKRNVAKKLLFHCNQWQQKSRTFVRQIDRSFLFRDNISTFQFLFEPSYNSANDIIGLRYLKGHSKWAIGINQKMAFAPLVYPPPFLLSLVSPISMVVIHIQNVNLSCKRDIDSAHVPYRY